MFTRILHWIHRLVNPPAKPRCGRCGDELLLDMEIRQRACVDCQQPPFLRRFAAKPERASL